MVKDDKKIEDLNKEEIMEAITTPLQKPVNNLDESADELRAMGFPDISEADDKHAMDEALKNIQITKVLDDLNQPKVDISIRDFLEKHLRFLESVSPNKSMSDLINTMTIEHAQAALKVTLKTTAAEAVIKKHLKTLRKKYR